ncbi:ATP-binding protein [Streptomyces uncialis]|uniref:ATP-binding protein n=1 Tax=Streptomyces uncialis TaxID=1048205 RepID=UPI0038180E34
MPSQQPSAALTQFHDEWSMEYSMVPRVVSLARRHTRRHVDRVGWEGDVEAAVLVVSELVSNAVRYARVAGCTLELGLRLRQGDLVVDVFDPLPHFPCFDRDTACAEDEGGRGLPLVRSVAALSWCPAPDYRGKRVQACLPGPARSPQD